MICPRHGLVARFEHALCGMCMREAVKVAEERVMEDKIRDLRYHSAEAILARLRGKPA